MSVSRKKSIKYKKEKIKGVYRWVLKQKYKKNKKGKKKGKKKK